MSKTFLPYGKQAISDADIEAVAQVLRGDYLTTGPKVAEFEKAFAERVGAKEAVVCANGTAALHLASMALGLGEGDIVLAPSMSFLASANGPHFTGAAIEFMDCDPDTGLVRPQDFSDALVRAQGRDAGQVRAAVVVHLNGEYADMDAIAALARENNVRLVEDACHAVGTRFATGENGMAEVGSCFHGDLACFSLHPVKTITMGEGGVVTTNNRDWAAAMRKDRSHGMTREPDEFTNSELAFDKTGEANPWYYEMAAPGYNYRATDFACALGLSQLAQFDGFLERRKALKARYDRLFAETDLPLITVATSQSCDPCRHLYPVLIDFGVTGKTRAQVMSELREEGVGTQVHYIPIHRQPYYRALNPALELPGADAYYARALSLPLYAQMEDADTDRVVEALKKVLG